MSAEGGEVLDWDKELPPGLTYRLMCVPEGYAGCIPGFMEVVEDSSYGRGGTKVGGNMDSDESLEWYYEESSLEDDAYEKAGGW
jgi:hypothetical protein